PWFDENSPNTNAQCREHPSPFNATNAAGNRELDAPEDHARVLFTPTEEGITHALRGVLSDGERLRTARPAFDDAESLGRWDEVFALPARAFPPRLRVSAIDPDWVLLLEETDVPDPELVENLVRAPQ